MKINLGGIEMPINAATKTFAILAKRGAGKTYTAGVLAEEFSKNNIPFVVFDPIDVWWGLRLNKTGKDKGLPVVVFGLEHADIPLTRDMGKEIARAIVKENISCVISTFGMPKVGMRHLIAEFAEELLNINNTPRHVFIEEAHEFVPQRVQGAGAKCFSAVESLVVMGRNRGIGVTLINQRAATINKDVLTQLDTLIALRNVGPQDRKALRDWVEFHTAEGDFEKFMASLPSLPTGEAWVWSPEFMSVFERVKIRERETFHPDREKLGHKFEMPKLDSIDIESFISKFKKDIKPFTPEQDSVKKMQRESKAEQLNNFVEEKRTEAVIDMKNEYESKLIEKDLEIRQLRKIIEDVKKALGEVFVSSSTSLANVGINGDSISLWMSKLGNGGRAKIFKLFVDNPRRKFTRQQIGLAVGLRSSTGSFSTYMGTLTGNKLILREGQEYYLNPNL